MQDKSGKHQLGTNHNSDQANQNGLDEIDKWAMNIGNAERTLNAHRPRRKHLQTA